MHRLPRPLAAVLVLLGAAAAARAVDIPITGLKLIVLDKTALASKAKTVFVAKDAAITKGAGTNPADIEATLDVAYDDVSGAFQMPQGGKWLVNSGSVAKYVDKTAPATGAVTVSVIKPGSLVKVVAKSLGDTPLDVSSAPSGTVYVADTIINAGDETRLCTQFTGCVHKEIAGGAGYKLICKGNSSGDAGCAAVTTTTTSTSTSTTIISGCFVGKVLTVEDTCTGLEWEKKTSAVGSGANPADPHDVDNTYQWSSTGVAADGDAYATFLAQLNTPPCFAGACDWRLPDESGQNISGTADPQELETILLAPYVCGTDPCIDPVFGPTASGYYLSSSTWTGGVTNAWVVQFSDGIVVAAGKTNPYAARAVRGAIVATTTTTIVTTSSTLATTTSTVATTTSTLATTTTTSTTLIPICGDGLVGGTEVCDPFVAGSCPAGESCNYLCSACAAVCGDGVLAGAEVCDFVAGSCPAGESCNGSCSACAVVCGDGLIGGAEVCDPLLNQGCPAGETCHASCSACGQCEPSASGCSSNSECCSGFCAACPFACCMNLAGDPLCAGDPGALPICYTFCNGSNAMLCS